MWLFGVSKEAWNVIELSFSNMLLVALMHIRAIDWKDWEKERWGPALPRAYWITSVVPFPYVCQECGLNNVFTSPDFASHLLVLLPRHLTKCKPPAVRLAPDLKWNSPWCSSVCTSVFISPSWIIRVRYEVHGVSAMYLVSLHLATQRGISLLPVSM